MPSWALLETYDPVMRLVRRVLAGLVLLIGAVLYVWVAAVRAVPEVKRRKEAARAARRAGQATPPAAGPRHDG